MHVYDSSYQRPKPSLLQPGDGIILYCSRTPEKVPTVAEVDAYRAAGVSVGFVFEDSADRAATNGYAAGVSDGGLAAQQARAKGHPKGKPVYFACDVIDPVNLNYCGGFRYGLGGYYEPRLYAGDRNLRRAETIGLHLGWQASAGSWSDNFYHSGDPGGHGTYEGAALWQVVGTSTIPGTDINIVNNPAWNGDDVTPADIQAIADAVWARGLTFPGGLTIPAGQRLAEVDNHVTNLPAATDIAAAVVAKLPTTAGGVTKQDVIDAVAQVLKSVAP